MATWLPAAMSNDALWITTAAQMGMGFILPFALTFVAIPLETFVMTARHVLGMLLVNALSIIAFCLRLLGSLLRQTAMVLLHLYDMVIFAPLSLSRKLEQRNRNQQTNVSDQSDQTQVASSETDHDEPRQYGYGGSPA